MSTITRAERDGSILIVEREPCMGRVRGLVIGIQEERVRSYVPFGRMLQL